VTQAAGVAGSAMRGKHPTTGRNPAFCDQKSMSRMPAPGRQCWWGQEQSMPAAGCVCALKWGVRRLNGHMAATTLWTASALRPFRKCVHDGPVRRQGCWAL